VTMKQQLIEYIESLFEDGTPSMVTIHWADSEGKAGGVNATESGWRDLTPLICMVKRGY
jgi:hypothetical protein